jgi:hypothetical protein
MPLFRMFRCRTGAFKHPIPGPAGHYHLSDSRHSLGMLLAGRLRRYRIEEELLAKILFRAVKVAGE